MPKSEKGHSEGQLEANGIFARKEQARAISAPSSRVNVAFPFSQIKLQEPSKELTELASLVLDLVAAMSEWVPEDRLEELQARAQAVVQSLR
jgi:hypothetical protein